LTTIHKLRKKPVALALGVAAAAPAALFFGTYNATPTFGTLDVLDLFQGQTPQPVTQGFQLNQVASNS
jgi:hypothetical protein